ncbi:SCO family protein [Aquabacter sp. P-9]|uniref:SCO family protein n=1 Tax=Aquabacter sediminis TaxID=3029197 RepID=UPI00237D4319|nr:SCO family protein [Aquabacter sp. P-9]MDE1566598.1 SCO family protein [Aquabacter sp. P-9]
MARFKIPTLALAATAGALLLLGAGLAVTPFTGGGSRLAPSGSASAAAPAAIGGPFKLASSKGGTLSDQDLKGAPFAIFFGFTHCPEICPTSLWEMSESLKRLGPEADKLKVLFVTVDPERDTPEILARYLQSFDPRIIGLSGSQKEMEAAAKAYRVYWRKVPTSDGDYTMDHTALIYLMDAKGGYEGFIAYKDDEATRDRKLRELLAKSAGPS